MRLTQPFSLITVAAALLGAVMLGTTAHAATPRATEVDNSDASFTDTTYVVYGTTAAGVDIAVNADAEYVYPDGSPVALDASGSPVDASGASIPISPIAYRFIWGNQPSPSPKRFIWGNSPVPYQNSPNTPVVAV